MAGAVLPISKDIKFLPAIMVKYVYGVPINTDINLNLDINNKFTFGVSGRVGGGGGLESADLLFFWQATDQIGVGAAYDFTLSRIRDFTAGSFEIMLQADLKPQPTPKAKKGKKNLANPRFFL
jgi:hypothetical protein